MGDPVFIQCGKAACSGALLVKTRERQKNKGTAEGRSRMRHLAERNCPCSGKHVNTHVHTPLSKEQCKQ